MLFPLLVSLVALCVSSDVPVAAQSGEWRSYGADVASTKYSPLDQIDSGNVGDLKVVWRQSTIPEAVRQGRVVRAPSVVQNTPLMADGRLYVSTGLGTVAALDAGTGEVVWFDPLPAGSERRGGASRGVAFWKDPVTDEARIIAVVGSTLVALDARTGRRYDEFGDGGEVDLTEGYDIRSVSEFRWRSAPVVVDDIVVIGSAMTDIVNETMPARKEMPPGDVRGFDVRTGEQLWIFHTVPQEGEFGNETWLTGTNEDRASWEYTGNTNMWAWASADEELGYVYLPLSTPTNDYYGGHRPGDNLFAESLVCLDVRTGERVWHFQAVHHGVWDYDFPAAPNLIDISVDGREIRAVAIVSKQGFTYVFDRVTGEPVWPIEERPVASGNVPGEWYAATQPFPTKPPPYEKQGVTVDDLINFTPELRQEAEQILARYVSGPLFTPPSIIGEGPQGTKGLVQAPGLVGGADWTGAGVDPEAGMLFVSTVRTPAVVGLTRSQHPRSNVDYVMESLDIAEGPQGLPLLKPPYGSLVAIDLNVGEIRWRVPNGDGPRDHPVLRSLVLPPLGQAGRVSPLITQTLVFLGEGVDRGMVVSPVGVGGKRLNAYHKRTGALVGHVNLPGGVSGAPITYLFEGRQFLVMPIGWSDMESEWVALALSE
ncbi:MAG: pyrroloquinoline quinone-dependent dehydrogenase [Acidobacteria bacterium]|nr:pyrroloquinoline quinone-dependent dehydrogenase [Acidobacteriota bacterium]